MRLISLILLAGFASAALAAYATQTNTLYNRLDTCSSGIGSDIDCVTNLRDGLQKMSDYIQDIRDLKEKMELIDSGFTTLSTVLKFAKYAPGIGTAISTIKTTIDVLKPTFTSAYNKVSAIDAKIYPQKDKVDTAVGHCDTAITYMTAIQTKCDQGKSLVDTTRNCINSMNSGTLKTTLGGEMESLGSAINPSFQLVNQALGNIGTACDAVESYANIILGWPDISAIIDGINDFFDPLEPILNFFADFQAILDKDLCMKDPWEALTELEIIEELAESPVNPGNWGWGRKRRSIMAMKNISVKEKKSVGLIRISKEQADAYLTLSRRGSVCFSVQDILDGIDSIFGFLLDLANDLIAEIMKNLPSFSIPGMPNFDNLFNLNFNWNLPDIDLNYDLSLFTDMFWFNWNCATQVGNVCAAASGDVSFSCGQSLATYNPLSSINFSFSWGRRKRNVKANNFLSYANELENIAVRAEKRNAEDNSQAVIESVEEDDDDNTITVNVIPPHDQTTRHDDKDVSAEEAELRIQQLTPEQRRRLMERLSNGGGSSAETTDSIEDTTDSIEDTNDSNEETTVGTTTALPVARGYDEAVAAKVADIMMRLQARNHN